MKFKALNVSKLLVRSPPSRGAWIEIPRAVWPWWRGVVAPLAGGVD